jgi:hypothetical protein
MEGQDFSQVFRTLLALHNMEGQPRLPVVVAVEASVVARRQPVSSVARLQGSKGLQMTIALTHIKISNLISKTIPT